MRVIEIKCWNCGNITRNYATEFSQMNSTELVMLQCFKCGQYFEERVHKPVPYYQLGEGFEYIWTDEEIEDEPYRKEWEEHKLHHLKMCTGNPELERLSYMMLSKHMPKLSEVLNSYFNGLMAGVNCAPEINIIYVSHKYIYNGQAYRSVWAKDICNEQDISLNDLCLIYCGLDTDEYKINKPDVGLGFLITIDSDDEIHDGWI